MATRTETALRATAASSVEVDEPEVDDPKSERDLAIEAAWGEWWEQPNEATRARLAELYFPLCEWLARQMATTLSDEVDVGDLVGYACEGLLDAIEKYDAAKGSFVSFARFRMRGAVYDQLRALDWVPRTERRHERELRAVRESFFLEHHRQPSLAEEAQLLGLSVTRHNRFVGRLATSRPLPIADAWTEEGPTGALPANDQGPLASWLLTESSEALQRALLLLPEREQHLLVMLFGENRSLTEAGAVMGVSQSRVCQIRRRALKLLRQELEKAGITEAREAVVA